MNFVSVINCVHLSPLSVAGPVALCLNELCCSVHRQTNLHVSVASASPLCWKLSVFQMLSSCLKQEQNKISGNIHISSHLLFYSFVLKISAFQRVVYTVTIFVPHFLQCGKYVYSVRRSNKHPWTHHLALRVERYSHL